jgi:hypothetical protein
MTSPCVPAVREIARVADVDGSPVQVGVDCDAVTISGPRPVRLGPDEREQFSRAYFEAERQAQEWAKAWTVRDG